jgi:lycopene cyclase domain-containing protein
MNTLYLAVDLGAASIPFLFSFHPRIRFHRMFGPAFSAIAIVAAAFILWDIYFTRLGVWGFNKEYLTGFYLDNLPIEEVLFFVCIPFSCLFTYFTLKQTIFKKIRVPRDRPLAILAGVAKIIFALFHLNQRYTSWALFFCGLTFLVVAARRENIAVLVLSYSVLLIPFFVVNGILTGTGLPRPVVWYNNAENMGIRVLTIPIEDFFYGMILIFLNIVVFEILSARRQAITAR